jgi:hypothetical protein
MSAAKARSNTATTAAAAPVAAQAPQGMHLWRILAHPIQDADLPSFNDGAKLCVELMENRRSVLAMLPIEVHRSNCSGNPARLSGFLHAVLSAVCAARDAGGYKLEALRDPLLRVLLTGRSRLELAAVLPWLPDDQGHAAATSLFELADYIAASCNVKFSSLKKK